MLKSQAMEKAGQLAEKFRAPGGDSWAGEWDEWPWALELLGQLVTLIGFQEVFYASGYVENPEHEAKGKVVIFTETTLITSTFEYVKRQHDQVAFDALTSAEATPAFRSMTVTGTEPLFSGPGDFPTRLELELRYASNPNEFLILPARRAGSGARRSSEPGAQLASFLPRLQGYLVP